MFLPRSINPVTKGLKGEWNVPEKRWNRFEAMVQMLEKRDIQLMLYLSPIHPSIRQTSVVDDDGTTKEGYRELVERLHVLANEHSNLIFLDLLRGGEHDFSGSMFRDLDHLNKKGATQLTRILDEVRKRYDAAGWDAIYEPEP